MNRVKNKIYKQDWLKLHPYEKQVSSDTYFIELSNRMLKIINQGLKNEFSEKTKRTIALSVAAYFEDVISRFGLWQGFTKKHFALYGKYLPFYRLTDDYIPDEINPEDIIFLIWSIIQPEVLETRETFINPENIGITTLGFALFTLIDEEYETAPENEILRDFFIKNVDYDNFYAFRSIISWLYYDSYLIAPYTEDQLEKALEGIEKQKEHADLLTYGITNELIFKNSCGPLALKSHEWISSIVGEDSDLGKMLLQTRFKYKIPKSYLITAKNDSGITLLPFDSSDVIFLRKDTMEKDMPCKPDDAVLCNLIYFNGKWELNGFMINIPKEEYDNNRDVAEKMTKNAEYSRNLYLKANNNTPVRYFKDDKELKVFFSKAYSLSEKIDNKIMKGMKNIVAFSDAEVGVTTISDIAVFIKDKENPCYDPKEAEDNGLILFTNYNLSQELIEYLIQNNLIPDLKMNSLISEERGKELVQENLDFMFRFFQPLSFSS